MAHSMSYLVLGPAEDTGKSDQRDIMREVIKNADVQSLRKPKGPRAFNVDAFLDSPGLAKTIVEYRRRQKIYAQGDPATTVMYIQEGGVKLSVVSR